MNDAPSPAAPPAVPAVAIRDLRKVYRNVTAVDGISVDIEAGEFFGLLGPNGAGKSTTIHAITGLVTITSGTIQVFGHDVVRDYRVTRRMIGLAPQEFNLDRYFDIRHLLIFQGGFFGMRRAEAERRADALLDLFGLADHAHLIHLKLSGGLKRRLLIAKALMHQPPLLILDEPTAGLDVELRKNLWAYLRHVNKEGVTILLTTHYIEEAEELCDRVAIIDHGRIIALDTPQNLIAQSDDGSLTVRVHRPLGEAARLITGPGVAVGDGGRTIVVSGRDRAQRCYHVLKVLHDHAIGIEDLDIRTTDLEDVFLRLTGRRLSDHPDRL